MIVLKVLFSPIVFALGFLTPLFAQTLDAAAWQLGNLPNIAVGAAAALTLGLIAQLRGGWLWHRS